MIDNFVKFFGEQAANPHQYIETAWKGETWTRGCPVGIPGLNQFAANGPALRRPVGPHPLGRNRDLRLLVRLHGRRRPLRRARRGGGPRTSMRLDGFLRCGCWPRRWSRRRGFPGVVGRSARPVRHQGLRADPDAGLPGPDLRRAQPPRLRGHLHQPERRHRPVAGARVLASGSAAALLDDPGPGPRVRPRRAGRDQRQSRAARPARQGTGARSPAQHPQGQPAHLRDLPARGDAELRGVGPRAASST